MLTPLDSSPDTSPSLYSTRSLGQARHKTKGTYVQRFKVLRDRNKNLPKLDFTAKATGIPKKLQGVGSFSRSYTYDSMKLPSISTSSVVTGVSGKSVHSDGYRRKSDGEKKSSSIPDGYSEPYNCDFFAHRDMLDLSALMSKTFENMGPGDKVKPPKPPDSKKPNAKGQRYENITYKKTLLKRHKVSEKTKGKSIIAQAEHHLKQTVEKELLQGKDKDVQKENTDSGFVGSDDKKKVKVQVWTSSTSPNDITQTSDTVTATPDDVTLLSPVTITTKSPTNSHLGSQFASHSNSDQDSSLEPNRTDDTTNVQNNSNIEYDLTVDTTNTQIDSNMEQELNADATNFPKNSNIKQERAVDTTNSQMDSNVEQDFIADTTNSPNNFNIEQEFNRKTTPYPQNSNVEQELIADMTNSLQDSKIEQTPDVDTSLSHSDPDKGNDAKQTIDVETNNYPQDSKLEQTPIVDTSLSHSDRDKENDAKQTIDAETNNYTTDTTPDSNIEETLTADTI